MRLTRTNALLVLVAVTAICLAGVDAMAQRGGGGRPGGGFGGFGGGGVLDIAVRPEVQKELDLLDDQVADLKKLAEAERAEARERMQGLFSGFNRDASDEERAAARTKIQEASAAAAKATQAKVDAILLPHQSKRLSQLAVQRRLRGGISGAFNSEEMSSKLGISNRQREELQAKARQAEEDLRARMAELRAQMQEDLLKSLTPEQQAKYKTLIGEPFEFAQDERPSFGRGGGGGAPGGRGQGGRGTPRGQRPSQ